MKLVANWRRVRRYAWSIRFSIAAAVFGGLEVGINLLSSDPPLPRGAFAGLAVAVSCAAAIARFVAQDAVSGEQK